MLRQQTLFELVDKVNVATKRIIHHCQTMSGIVTIVGAFSGGKDSCVIKELVRLSGVKVQWFYNQVGLDPPELLAFIKQHHPDVTRVLPPKPIFTRMIEKQFPPLRKQRWCCEHLKEYHGEGLVITGVRWAESSRRAKRLLFEPCKTNKKRFFLSPIIDWSDDDVWEFITENKLPYCPLYDEGFKRLGCILCPMASEKARRKEAKRWPRMANAWRAALGRLIQSRQAAGKESIANCSTGEELFAWYLGNSQPRTDPDQQCFKFEE